MNEQYHDWINDLIGRRELTLESEPVDSIPHIRRPRPGAVEFWRCTMRNKERKVQFYVCLHEGEGPPRLDQILLYWAQQAQLYDAFDDFLEWAEAMELDPAKCQARDHYDDMVHHAQACRALLSDEDYGYLKTGLEIQQAIADAKAAMRR